MNRIKTGISEAYVVSILTELINNIGWYDSIDLNDRLEKIKSPLVTYDQNGNRKLNPSIIKQLKQTFPTLEFDRSDNCWYKR